MGLTLVLIYVALLGVLGLLVLVFYQHKQDAARKQQRARLMGMSKKNLPAPLQAPPPSLQPYRATHSAAVNNELVADVVLVSTADTDFYESARLGPWDALGYLRNGDINGARLAMQKLSYIVYEDKKKHPENVVAFTQLMCLFVKIDPLFHIGLAAIQPVVSVTPGIRQTALYNYMPMDNEHARYVLYFAHETGHVVRRKKGNSYEVFLPGQNMPEVITKSKRAKK